MSLPTPATLATIFSGVARPMLGLTFELDRGAPAAGLHWRSAVVRVPGAAPLHVAVSSDEAGCGELARAIFREAPSPELVDDALRELVNVTAGAVKWHLRIQEPLVPPEIVDGGAPPISARGAVSAVVRTRAGLRVAIAAALA